jgi:hypothetical protein
MPDQTHENGQPVSVGSTGGSAYETPAGLVMLELASAADRAGKTISHLQWSLAFTLGKTKAAIDLLEAGDTRNALECLRLAHANGCYEMDNIPLPSPNNELSRRPTGGGATKED